MYVQVIVMIFVYFSSHKDNRQDRFAAVQNNTLQIAFRLKIIQTGVNIGKKWNNLPSSALVKQGS